MIKVTNLDEAFDIIDKWSGGVEEQLSAVAKGLANYALNYVLPVSAQYSGDFAANWNLSVNTPDRTFRQDLFPGRDYPRHKGSLPPFAMGDLAPQSYAIANNQGKLSGFKLGDSLWLANTAFHTDYYSFKIEDNQIQFRASNSGAPLARTFENIRREFGTITKNNVGKLL